MSYQRLHNKKAVTLDGIHLWQIGSVIALLMVFGCSSEGDVRSDRNASGATEAPFEVHGNLASDASIGAGYGVPSCYIGMPVSELGKGWERVPEPDLSNEIQLNKKSGMYIQEEDGRVASVDFQYADDELEPYHGSTHEGISATSSLSDVRARYGEPSYILKSTRSNFGSFPNAEETIVDYVESGIQFQFVNDRLRSISVRSPNNTFDYRGFEKAMGRSIVFIRK